MNKMEKVPQICPATGISYDYINEYTGASIIFSATHDIRKAMAMIRKYPVKTYEERFAGCDNVIDAENEKGVRMLDVLARAVNKKSLEGNLTDLQFNAIVKAVERIIKPSSSSQL